MENNKNEVSGKWEKSYTWVLIANAIYLVLFYFIMTYFS